MSNGFGCVFRVRLERERAFAGLDHNDRARLRLRVRHRPGEDDDDRARHPDGGLDSGDHVFDITVTPIRLQYGAIAHAGHRGYTGRHTF